MPQFRNEAFQFDFVKCLAMQTLRQSVAMAWQQTYHFISYANCYKCFILSKSILIIFFSSYPYLNKSLWHLDFPTLTATRYLFLDWPPQSRTWELKQFLTVTVFSYKMFKLIYFNTKVGQEIKYCFTFLLITFDLWHVCIKGINIALYGILWQM